MQPIAVIMKFSGSSPANWKAAICAAHWLFEKFKEFA